MRLLLIASLLAATSFPVIAAPAKVPLVEACSAAIILNSGVLPKTAPAHVAEAQFCLDTVDAYMSKHCPTADGWKAVEAVSTQTTSDDKAIVAACAI